MANVKLLRNRRGKTVASMQALLKLADDKKRDLTPEESKKYDALFDKQATLDKQITRELKQRKLNREMAATEEKLNKAKSDRGKGKTDDKTVKDAERDLASVAFTGFLRTGKIIGEGTDELRALQADADVEGGFLMAPEQFVNQLIKFVDDEVFIRQRATVLTVANADSLGIPSLDTDMSDSDWTTELDTGNEDSDMAFGKRELHPHPLAKRVKISNKLLRKLPTIDALVMGRLAYKFGVTQEKAFLTGDGSQKPLGVYVASANGISTARDVSDGNTTSEIKMDGLINAKYSLKSQYWANAAWNFHRDAMKIISKLKDGEGQYIWRPSVREGEPDMLLGHPIDVSEFAPNTFTTGQYVGMFADFSHYWIADALTMTMQRLAELYAETNQTGIIGRLETDGMPVLEEAFVRVKLG